MMWKTLQHPPFHNPFSVSFMLDQMQLKSASPPLPPLPLPKSMRGDYGPVLAKGAMPQRGVQLGEEIQDFPSH